MGALPICHIGFWLAKSNVGAWPFGGESQGVISRLRARDRKSWPDPEHCAVREPWRVHGRNTAPDQARAFMLHTSHRPNRQ